MDLEYKKNRASLINFLKFVKYSYFNILKKYDFFLFNKRWRYLNEHNYTNPIDFFPIEKVIVGKKTYGQLSIKSFNEGDNEKLVIGNYVSIAQNVHFILGGNHRVDTFCTYPLKSILIDKTSRNEADSLSRGPIIIEDEVWIGFGCTILSGVRIGKGAIIAAGSLVNRDIEPYTLCGGVPAKMIKYRFDKDLRNELLKASLLNFRDIEIIENINSFYEELNINSILLKR